MLVVGCVGHGEGVEVGVWQWRAVMSRCQSKIIATSRRRNHPCLLNILLQFQVLSSNELASSCRLNHSKEPWPEEEVDAGARIPRAARDAMPWIASSERLVASILESPHSLQNRFTVVMAFVTKHTCTM